MILSKINVNVINYVVTRILHFLQAPVFAFAGDGKSHFAGSLARRAIGNMTDSRGDRAVEFEFRRINRSDDAVNLYEIRAFSLLAFQTINSVSIRHRRRAEPIPTDPLQRKKMPTEQHVFRFCIINNGFILRKTRRAEYGNRKN